MTRNRRNQPKDEGHKAGSVRSPEARRESVVNEQGKPILAHVRMASYGSCDEGPREGPANKLKGQGHPSRHAIGSDVFDFGEATLIWPRQLSQRLTKKPSKLPSWLGFSEASNKSEAPLIRKDSIPVPIDTATRIRPLVPSIPHHIVDRARRKS